MSVPVLSCPCGLRMKAKGAIPGRVGRCPKCGRTLTVPEPVEDSASVPVEVDAKPVDRGYVLKPTFQPPVGADPGPSRPARSKGKRRPIERARSVEVSREVESWWWPDVFFPARGAEGLVIVAMLGLVYWGVMVLIPELCLAFMADAARLQATMMGVLVSLIVALPSLMLGPLAITYAFQYLGRVLVSGAMGEITPPRPPDRNFEGLFHGLGPWLVWLACGASVGLGPVAVYTLARGEYGSPNRAVVFILVVIGLPYALMSLLATFLHDGGIPRPALVVGALMRFHVRFLTVCVVEAAIGLVLWGAFAATYSLREGNYWTYLPLMLVCWMLAHWMAIVAMRALGVFYHHHASVLRWHRDKPWWNVTPGT